MDQRGRMFKNINNQELFQILNKLVGSLSSTYLCSNEKKKKSVLKTIFKQNFSKPLISYPMYNIYGKSLGEEGYLYESQVLIATQYLRSMPANQNSIGLLWSTLSFP